MPIIEIREQQVNVDIRAELQNYDWGNDAKWSDEKLIARSPFRDDTTPSFFVRLEPYQDYPAGIWSDSGAYDDRFAKGGFVKLLSFLRNETWEETEEYLIDTYGRREGAKRVLIPPRIARPVPVNPLDPSKIDVLPSPYLSKRGIREDIQIAAGTGRGPYKGYVALPWCFPDGRLMNVKYRATKGKMFFYEDDAYPIGRLVWGADSVYEAGVAIICEAEIDALSWRTAGYEAVALGHGGISEEQAEILVGLPVNRYIAGGDNDLVGKRFNEQIKRVLGTRKPVGELNWDGFTEKDANDVLRAQGTTGLFKLINNASFPQRFKKLSR